MLHGRLGLAKGCAVSELPLLRPTEAGIRLGVPTRVVIRAMYESKLPRVRLDDGTLGIPADAIDGFVVTTS